MMLHKIVTATLLATATGTWLVGSGCTKSDPVEGKIENEAQPPEEKRVLNSKYTVPSKRPLIYFSNTDPAQNNELQLNIINELNLDPEEKLSLVFGGNKIGNYTLLVVKGSKDTAMQFDHVSQLFSFLVKNGWHSKEQGYSFSNLTDSLFYQSRPLQLTCGKYSTYFITLAVRQMGVNPDNCRNILVYPHTGGGHSLREIYFKDLKKWVMFDLDAGLIPVLDETPLHMLELCLATEDEYEKATLSGLELYGRGPMDNIFGQGPAAKGWADGLLKSSRFHFALFKTKHHVMLPVEDIHERTRAILDSKKDNRYYQVYHNKPEVFRFRYYKASHTRMNSEGRERVLADARAVWSEVMDEEPGSGS